MSKLHVLVLTALVTSGCAAQVDEREMNYLASALTKGLSEFLCSRLRVGSIHSDGPAPHITRQVV